MDNEDYTLIREKVNTKIEVFFVFSSLKERIKTVSNAYHGSIKIKKNREKRGNFLTGDPYGSQKRKKLRNNPAIISYKT